jgi:hypothetical protein
MAVALQPVCGHEHVAGQLWQSTKVFIAIMFHYLQKFTYLYWYPESS